MLIDSLLVFTSEQHSYVIHIVSNPVRLSSGNQFVRALTYEQVHTISSTMVSRLWKLNIADCGREIQSMTLPITNTIKSKAREYSI